MGGWCTVQHVIAIHDGKTHVWNRSGITFLVCDDLQRRAIQQDPTAQVFMGSGVPTHRQGIKVLGCPLGHEDFVITQLEAVGRKHQQAIPTWLRILICASSDQSWRSNLQVGTIQNLGAERSRVAGHHPAVSELIIGSLQEGPNCWSWTVWKGLWCRSGWHWQEPELQKPGGQRAGWHHEAASRVERHF